jgi:hypothetical protein
MSCYVRALKVSGPPEWLRAQRTMRACRLGSEVR